MKLTIQSLDLNKHLLFPGKKELELFYRRNILPQMIDSYHSSILDHNKTNYNIWNDFQEKGFSYEKSTLYINHHSKKQRSLTTCIYCPQNKDNEEKMFIPHMLKIELRALGGFLQNNSRLLSKVGTTDKEKKENPNIVMLLNLLDKGGLDKLFDEWFKKYIGDWNKYEEFQIENLN
ncbi:MAG: hypothetical protein JEY71_10060 [Sphaerochaeta sp.]|nr:hypothetical protein [Sphaerochaeta sp.]